jgi:hypothetical protein
VVNAHSPGAWYPLSYSGCLLECVVQWAPSLDWTGSRFDDQAIDSAIQHAKESVAEWQSFWNNDARWQQESPVEWLRTHCDRLKRHIAILGIAQDYKPSEHANDLDTAKAVGHAIEAIRDLSNALANDGSDLGLQQDDETIGLVKRIKDVAGDTCPPVLQAELASPEFWSAAGQLVGRLDTIAARAADARPQPATASNARRRKPSEKKAYGQYLAALRANAQLEAATMQEVYRYITDPDNHILDESEVLPRFETWERYVRGGNDSGMPLKNAPRAGRSHGGSIVRAGNI